MSLSYRSYGFLPGPKHFHSSSVLMRNYELGRTKGSPCASLSIGHLPLEQVIRQRLTFNAACRGKWRLRSFAEARRMRRTIQQ